MRITRFTAAIRVHLEAAGGIMTTDCNSDLALAVHHSSWLSGGGRLFMMPLMWTSLLLLQLLHFSTHARRNQAPSQQLVDYVIEPIYIYKEKIEKEHTEKQRCRLRAPTRGLPRAWCRKLWRPWRNPPITCTVRPVLHCKCLSM